MPEETHWFIEVICAWGMGRIMARGDGEGTQRGRAVFWVKMKCLSRAVVCR